MALAIAFAAVGGLIVGSFLNVVVYRLPRGESLTHPRSRCPQLRHAAARDRQHPGRLVARAARPCHHCGAPISARYPLVELTTGALYAAVVATQDDAVRIVLGLLLVTALVPIALIDLDHRIIPNRITGPAAIAAVIAIAALDTDFLPEAAHRGRRGRRVLPHRRRCSTRAGMGMGDVKLAGVLGLYLGRAVAPGDPHRARRRRRASAPRSSRARGPRRGARPRCPSAPSSRSAAWSPSSSATSSSTPTSTPSERAGHGRSGPWTHVGHSPARASGPGRRCR